MDSQEDKERDNAAKIATAKNEGLKQGLKQGKEEMARNMLNKGFDIKLVSEISGLTIEEIKSPTK